MRDPYSKYSAGKKLVEDLCVRDFIFIMGKLKWDIYCGRCIVGDLGDLKYENCRLGRCILYSGRYVVGDLKWGIIVRDSK